MGEGTGFAGLTPAVRRVGLAACAAIGLVGAAVAQPRIDPVDCWFSAPSGRATSCFEMTVPRNHLEPSGGTLRLAVVVVRAPGPAVGEPVILVPGGPGASAGIGADEIAEWFALSRELPWLDARDLILFAPRGVSPSSPNLECAEVVGAVKSSIATRGRMDEEALATASVATAMVDCVDRLRGAGVVLTDFTVADRVGDVIDLAQAMRLETWTLVGASDGTRVALKVAEQRPQGLRALVLDSVLPPDFRVGTLAEIESASDMLLHICRERPGCRAHLADVDAWLAETEAALTRDPIVLTVDLDEGADARLELDGAGFRVIVAMMGQYSPLRLSLPIAVDLARDGDDDVLARVLAYMVEEFADRLSRYLFLKIRECAEDRARAELDPAETFDCDDDFDLKPIDRRWVAPVTSDIPALLVAGELDTVTPPSYTRHAAATLSRSYVFVVPRRGHGVLWEDACLNNLVTAFLDRPEIEPSHPCLKGKGLATDEELGVEAVDIGR